METVIPPHKKSGHVIQKYRFKVLTREMDGRDEASGGGVQPYAFKDLSQTGEEPSSRRPEEAMEEAPPASAEASEEMAQMSEEEESASGGSEELLRRIDELTTDLVKTQMALEKKEAECEERAETSRREGFDEGMEAGRAACREESEKELAPIRERLAAAVEALEESRELFLKKVDTIEEELIETALDLAKQVVVKEVERNSKEVALRLAKLLLSEVKEAANVTLRVNPEDYDYLRERLGDSERVTIVSDPAVGPGGVIVVSDIGHIDGEIMHRFERIKEAVFGTAPSQGEG